MSTGRNNGAEVKPTPAPQRLLRLMTPAERLAKWRAQGVYTMASEALLAAYTPERVCALLLAAKGTRLLTTSREFGANFFLETPDAGGRPDEV